MMCYMDVTFCDESTCSHWCECHKALTDEVRDKADKWWGKPGVPISVFAGKPECYRKEEG